MKTSLKANLLKHLITKKEQGGFTLIELLVVITIIVVLAPDLPLPPGQLERLSRRAAIGIGRAGTPGGNNSGDIFLAFSTANEMPLPQLSGAWRQMTMLNDERLDPVYMAAVEAVDEAVLNALCAAEDVPLARPAKGICRAIDTARMMKLMREPA